MSPWLSLMPGNRTYRSTEEVVQLEPVRRAKREAAKETSSRGIDDRLSNLKSTGSTMNASSAEIGELGIGDWRSL